MKADRPGPEVVREHDSLAALQRRAANALLRGRSVELFAHRSSTGEWTSVCVCASNDELLRELKAHPDVRGMREHYVEPPTQPLETVRRIEETATYLGGCDLIARGFPVALLVRGSAITTQPITDVQKLREHYKKTPAADIGIRLGRGFAALRFSRGEHPYKTMQLFRQRGWLQDAACFHAIGGATVFLFRTNESIPNVSLVRGVAWIGSGAIEAPPSLEQEWISEGPMERPHPELAALLTDPVKRAAIRQTIADPATQQQLSGSVDLSTVDLLDHVLFEPPCYGRPSWDGPAAAGLPAVFVGPDEYRVGTSVLEALARDPAVYRRGNLLVTVNPGENFRGLRAKTNVELGPSINILSSEGLRALVTRSVCLVRRNPKDGTINRVHPPSWLSGNLMSRGASGDGMEHVPPIDGVRETPILRADGTVLAKPGYDADTAMLLLDHGCYPDVPEAPSQNEAIAAVAMLKEAFCDFPFEGEADRSAALAAVLTFFARPAYSGPTPLFFIEANKAGTGKGLIADAITQITLGRPVGRQAPSEEDEEIRKRITSIILSGTPVGFIDNIENQFGGPALDAVMTAEVWTDRLLGGNGLVELQNRTLWICTGNNPEFRGDMSRRICRIRMVTPEQHPEMRTNYKHEQLIDWIKQVRPQLVRAALTILRAYQCAGQPKQKMRSWGSFEGWSAYVRASLVFAGCVDPAPEAWRLEEMTPQVSAERMLVLGLRELLNAEPGKRASASRVLQKLQQNDRAVHQGQANEQWQTFRSACEELFALKPGQLPNARQLGRRLTRLRDTNIIGNVLRADTNATLNTLEYSVHDAQQQSTETSNSSAATEGIASPVAVDSDPSNHGGDVDEPVIDFGEEDFPPIPDLRDEPPPPWLGVQRAISEQSANADERPRVACVSRFVDDVRELNPSITEPSLAPKDSLLVMSWSSRRDQSVSSDCEWSLQILFNDIGQFDWEFQHKQARVHRGNGRPLDSADDDLRHILSRLHTLT
jgi:hypothetical protein